MRSSAVQSVATTSKDAGVQKQLSNLLSNNYARVMDLMKDLDTNDDGVIDREEFVSGLRNAGFDIAPAALYGIFDTIDEDGSGIIDFRELSRAIKSQRAFVIAVQKEREEALLGMKDHLRSKLGGMLVAGDDRSEVVEPELKGAKDRAAGQESDLAAQEDELLMTKQASTVQIQAMERGRRVRQRPPERQWRFATTHVCELRPGEDCVFHVRENERLDLVSAKGSGRVLLDVTGPDGRSLLPAKSHVWDSSLQTLHASLKAASAAAPAFADSLPLNGRPAPIFSAPGATGGQTYVFTVTSAPQGLRGDTMVKLKFSLEMRLLERQLVEEPHPPPAPANKPPSQPLTESATFKQPIRQVDPLSPREPPRSYRAPAQGSRLEDPSSASLQPLSARTSARADEVFLQQRREAVSREDAVMSTMAMRERRQREAASAAGSLALSVHHSQFSENLTQLAPCGLWSWSASFPPPATDAALGLLGVGPPRVGAGPAAQPPATSMNNSPRRR